MVGFKRVFLLSVTAGVGGELIRNAFFYSATIESLTPIWGLVGYLIGLFFANKDTIWRYNHKEKVHMILIIILVTSPYLSLAFTYKNISSISMLAAFIIGFSFYYCDPKSEKHAKYRIPSIIFLVSIIAVSAFIFFFKSQPALVEIL